MSVTSTKPEAPRPAPRLPEELLASPTFLLKRLGFAAKESAFAAYQETGLRPYHHAILILVGERPCATQGAIADALGYDKGQLVGLLDELEEQKLVERRRDSNDRRRHVVRITAEGKRVLRRLRALAHEVEEDFLSPLSEREQERLHALLLRLAEKHEPLCALAKPPESTSPG